MILVDNCGVVLVVRALMALLWLRRTAEALVSSVLWYSGVIQNWARYCGIFVFMIARKRRLKIYVVGAFLHDGGRSLNSLLPMYDIFCDRIPC